ncbi:MAG: hypothetical protein MR648_04670 [Clostridiales bacterium]|nr:hypothetical protein [Clostridiales bacterium]MDY4180048.1 hypothetical protein [Pseudoflavonifractor sp.]
MLIVKAPLLTDKVCAALDGYDKDGVTIKLVSRKGMELDFEMTGKSGFDAASLAKSIVRSHDFGNALYFSAMWKD